MKQLTDGERQTLREQNRDATLMEEERTRVCWKDCDLYDAYHTQIDREVDRLEDAMARDGDYALWEAAEDAAEGIDWTGVPFA